MGRLDGCRTQKEKTGLDMPEADARRVTCWDVLMILGAVMVTVPPLAFARDFCAAYTRGVPVVLGVHVRVVRDVRVDDVVRGVLADVGCVLRY